jgi:uncharacterized membrane protein SpoIIM required for sporulation
MNEEQFVGRRDADWRRLTELLDQADGKGAHSLSGAELKECVRLYRRVTRDLAVARTKSRNIALVEHLNDLVGRAYGILYKAPRKPILPAAWSAVQTSARTVRQKKWFVLASGGIFFGSWLFIFLLLSAMPEMRNVVIDPASERLFEHWKQGVHEDRTGGEQMMMGALYASNNPRVAIVAGAMGAATFGFGSIYLLFTNGVLIGALSYEMASVNQLYFLLSSIAPHGVPELSGVVIAGAAGLLLGWALINPGQRRRGDALRAVGKDAIVLIMTSVVLMFIAAPIEAFFSFNPQIPQDVKAFVAVATLIAWLAFWIAFGRETQEETSLSPTAQTRESGRP